MRQAEFNFHASGLRRRRPWRGAGLVAVEVVTIFAARHLCGTRHECDHLHGLQHVRGPVKARRKLKRPGGNHTQDPATGAARTLCGQNRIVLVQREGSKSKRPIIRRRRQPGAERKSYGRRGKPANLLHFYCRSKPKHRICDQRNPMRNGCEVRNKK